MKLTRFQHYAKYYFTNLQKEFKVVSRLSTKTGWGDRCDYLDNKYTHHKHYNHRSVLDSEVVIEFDLEDKKVNLKLINQVEKNLKRDGMAYNLWFSGGKSYHLHFFIQTKECGRLPLLKKTVMRYYNEGNTVIPDFRLADTNHLVRAEFGLHEGTQLNKRRVRSWGDFLVPNKLPTIVWEAYSKATITVIKRSNTIQTKDMMRNEKVKKLMDPVWFRNVGDGRERVLFVLIHLLKKNDVNPHGKFTTQEELVTFLQDWYKYCGGYKIDRTSIKWKVTYHWNRRYVITDYYIDDLMEELGVK